MVDATQQTMLEQHESAVPQDLPLDFTQFLSERMGIEPATTLSLLGSCLLSFEPSGRYACLSPICTLASSGLPKHSQANVRGNDNAQ
jgi:hypothetical protein